MRKVWLRPLALAVLVLFAACRGNDEEEAAPMCDSASRPACDIVAESAEMCPHVLCARCAVGTFRCCTCTESGWQVKTTDCTNPCDAGGVDAP